MNRMARFRFKTDMAVQFYATAIHELFYTPNLREFFPHYLMTLHSIIRASEPLLLAASNEATRRWQQGDQGCRGLGEYLAAHVREEANHATWLLEDMETLGIAREHVLSRNPGPEVASLVGSQYYWIHHYHPGVFLGYMAVFEGYPLPVAAIDQFKQLTLLPDPAFRTMLLHTELDVGHSADLFGFLENCALPDAVFDDMALNAIGACTSLAQIYRGLAAGDASVRMQAGAA